MLPKFTVVKFEHLPVPGHTDRDVAVPVWTSLSLAETIECGHVPLQLANLQGDGDFGGLRQTLRASRALREASEREALHSPGLDAIPPPERH